MCYNTQKKKAAGAGKDFTLFFGVMLHFNFKCASQLFDLRAPSSTDVPVLLLNQPINITTNQQTF